MIVRSVLSLILQSCICLITKTLVVTLSNQKSKIVVSSYQRSLEMSSKSSLILRRLDNFKVITMIKFI